MKVFLLSDLVVHELASMQLEGKWLSSEHFRESMRLWLSRYGGRSALSTQCIDAIEHQAIQIATRLKADEDAAFDGSPLTQLFLDIPAVNYAHPLSVRALSASLEVCRQEMGDSEGVTNERSSGRWPSCRGAAQASPGCHPAFCLFVCSFGDAQSLTSM
jgi:hypothetical protein